VADTSADVSGFTHDSLQDVRTTCDENGAESQRDYEFISGNHHLSGRIEEAEESLAERSVLTQKVLTKM
jgi:predicted HicB family RNase H-like nuclease